MMAANPSDLQDAVVSELEASRVCLAHREGQDNETWDHECPVVSKQNPQISFKSSGVPIKSSARTWRVRRG